jgi:subtilase family serine protease
MWKFLLSSIVFAVSTISVVFSVKWIQMEPDVVNFGSPAWEAQRIVKETEPIHAVFVLRHEPKAIEAFANELSQISLPNDPRYGKWMSKLEVIEKLAPSDQNVQIVKNYLNSEGTLPEQLTKLCI